ncbi:MAG: helix-turn-helix domain-containing protein [Eubacteriales bacterium]|jgi:carbohydrate diacid regulator|nr:helix-turn-helix domain-containing protein [Eubacteriales bacterium]MDY5229863.1 helix-turn-helix domain-containing protein [Eubacteriales bacterium]
MQNRLFQNTLTQLKKDIKRVMGVIDDTETVIACSDEMRIGNTVDNIFTVFDTSGEVRCIGGFTYKKIETFNKMEYLVFCEGDDEIASSTCSLMGVHFLTLKQYYDEKYDKNSFVKNIILDNIMPGDVIFRTRELHLTTEAKRVVYLVRIKDNAAENSVVDILQNLFPDKKRDFVIRIDDNDLVVIKEFEDEISKEKSIQLGQVIYDTLAGEGMISTSVGISTIVDTIQELAQAYREARIALEVGKVFDTEKNVISYDNLGIGRLIYQLPTTLCELFLNEVFKKESINVLDSETIYTIQKFFENNLNVSETSRKLFVHRNTLVYRLDKIKKLTGLDLREFDDAIIFKVAMMVNKYLTSEPTRI